MSRRGFALLLALAALLVLGMVATTGVTLAMREAALGRAAMADAKARGAADASLAEGFQGWSQGIIPFAPGDSVVLPPASLPGALEGRLVLHALGGPIFALRSTGEALGPGGVVLARSRIELLIRLDSAGPDSLVYPRAITRSWRPIP